MTTEEVVSGAALVVVAGVVSGAASAVTEEALVATEVALAVAVVV